MAHIFKSAIFTCLVTLSPVSAQEMENTPLAMLSMIEKSDWEQAKTIAQNLNQPAAQKLVLWSRLRAGEGEWNEYRDFLDQNPQWPGLKRLRKQAELAITDRTKKPDMRRVFMGQPAQTGQGALWLANLDPSVAADAWLDLNLSTQEQAVFLDRFKNLLTPLHQRRLENLLWRGALTQAQAMLSLVPIAYRANAQTRIDLQRGTLPEKLEINTAGIAYDRFQYLIKQGEWDAAQNALIAVTGAENKLSRPQKWAKRRRGFARRAMRAGDVQAAYDLARYHYLTSGSDYADLEWLSGYIALQYLQNPDQALVHFKNFEAVVKSPISSGRASYWLGQTYEALKDYENAAQSYRKGAKFQTSFYGQLSAQRNRVKPDPTLAGLESVGDWRRAPFVKDSVFQAATILLAAGETAMARQFLVNLVDKLPLAQLPLLAEYTRQSGADFATVSIAKRAVRRGVIMPAAYFPLTDLATFAKSVPAEVALSIARRESELNPAAISPAGARGLMQVMPATARNVADDIGVDYDVEKLTDSWEYNATLGTAYLGGMFEKYNGSYILAFAAYNAGPNRVDEWIKTYGDPRTTDTDALQWIEHIPYRETRNYVMRVMESLHVYRARIAGKTLPLRIFQDISR